MKFLFTNIRTLETVEVEAVDGFWAWQNFKSMREMPKAFNPWNLGLICQCGKYAGSHMFCSKPCYLSYKASLPRCKGCGEYEFCACDTGI